MIELHITHTCKGYSPRDDWRNAYQSKERFPDIAAAKAWLSERYGKSKRAPMYRDGKDGAPVKVGYVIGYRGEDQDRSAPDGIYRYLGQDWVEFVHIVATTPAGI